MPNVPAIPTNLPSPGPIPFDLVGVVQTVVEAAEEYGRICQQETTRRREISAQERVVLERIAAQREFFLTYLDRSFDERAENFGRLFDVLDTSLQTGDAGTVSQTLSSIVDLARSSPLADLADLATVQKQLDNPNHTWEL